MTDGKDICFECQERPAEADDGSQLCQQCSRKSREDFRLAMTYALRSACDLNRPEKPLRQITHVEPQNATGTNSKSMESLIRDGLDRLAREYRRLSMCNDDKARAAQRRPDVTSTAESNFTPERATRDARGLGEDDTTRGMDGWNDTNTPPCGVRVLVTRQNGDSLIARRDHKPLAIFRDPLAPHWIDDNDKFIDIAMNPVVSWKAINTQGRKE